MRPTPARLLFIAFVLAVLPSCTTGTLVPESQSMSAARAGLDPDLRIFYDSLEDYGDWKLIEPLGYVFRPHVNFVAWRPYQEGFWSPSDSYGWIWVSGDPFGWATDHYGRWTYDRFDGWVWVPGVDWAPAWVTWEANDVYVGWAPILARGQYDDVPGGAFSYAAASQLASTDLQSRSVPAATVMASGPMERVDRAEKIEGVVVPLGPSIGWVEQRAGALHRARLVEGVPPGGGKLRTPAAGGLPQDGEVAIPAAPADSTRSAGAIATRDARRVIDSKMAPDRLTLVRPIATAAPPARLPGLGGSAKKGRAPQPAKPDSAR